MTPSGVAGSPGTRDSVAPEAAPGGLSAAGAFFQRHDVTLAEAVWLVAHVAFDVLIVIAWVFRQFPQAPQFLAINLGTLALVLVLRPALRRATSGPFWILRHWYTVLFYGMFFMECGSLVPAINPREIDPQLAQLDRMLCGGDPVAFLERLHLRPLTEFLQVCYASYYFLPLIAGGQIMARCGTRALASSIGMISVAFYASYASYFIFPAVGPRFFPPFDEGLGGYWAFAGIRHFLGNAEGRMHDCMPSGHTAITLMTLLYAWRVHKPTFWSILPFAAGLVFSTVYLRYHYVVDLIVAVPFTVVALAAGMACSRAWDRFTGLPPAPQTLPAARLDAPASQTV